MKLVVLATPRTGSTAFCSTFTDHDYDEILSIENLILPRSNDGTTILYNQIPQTGSDALSTGDFETAWRELKTTSGLYLNVNEDLEQYYTDKYPSIETFRNEHRRRWKILSEKESWIIKIMCYHHVPLDILHEIFEQADSIVILKRRDVVSQAISIFLAQQLPTNEWHVTEETEIGIDNIIFPYDQIVPMIEHNIYENKFFEEQTIEFIDKTQTLYYEDIDFSNSKHRKLYINSNIDRKRCYDIAKEAGYDYTHYYM